MFHVLHGIITMHRKERKNIARKKELQNNVSMLPWLNKLMHAEPIRASTMASCLRYIMQVKKVNYDGCVVCRISIMFPNLEKINS